MITYNIYLPPDSALDGAGQGAKFLPDGKPWLAAFIPPAWLLWHRLWWGFFIYLAIVGALSLLIMTQWREAAIFLSVIPGLYLLLEGHELIRQKYETKGWKFAGVVHGTNIDEAEMRYFHLRHGHRISRQLSSESQGILTQSTSLVTPKTKSAEPQSTGLFPLDDRS